MAHREYAMSSDGKPGEVGTSITYRLSPERSDVRKNVYRFFDTLEPELFIAEGFSQDVLQ
ncbi:hypothetical protein [Candidatus Dactylopiibacterium carminicum]|nr:hypothetical protein [Candidatus Dactylopiibacterium carminicum]